MPSPDQHEFQTVAEVAARLRKSPSVLRQWRHKGVGPRSYRIGGEIRYKRVEVEQWLANELARTVSGDAA